MPKYRFHCECGAEVTKYTSASTSSLDCASCHQQMQRQIPSHVEQSTVKELADAYTGIHLPPDNKEILDARRSEYFWSVEVPRLVNEYPVEHSLQEGWLYLDERGKIQLQTKPPYKR